MNRWEFRLPDIGEGVTEGEIVAWLVHAGDVVGEDQPVIEVMTDKATVTITTPRSGTVLETRGKVGDVVPVHAVIVVFQTEGAVSEAVQTNGGRPSVVSSAAETQPIAVGDIDGPRPDLPGARAYFNDKPLATPATRKLARDMNVDLRRVPPSGPQGRVTKTDVVSFRTPAPVDVSHGADPARDAMPRAPVRVVPSPPMNAERTPGREERVPFAGLRRKIAQKMSLSTGTAAHFTFVEECDATELKALRERLRKVAEAQGVNLTFLPFIVKAVVLALQKHPMLNARLDESAGEIVFQKYYNIGIATATEGGLLVPVVKDADHKSILDIASEIDRHAEEARAGRTKLEDLQGSTFTITSLGAQGGLLATPIINFPEVAILGIHQIKRKPIVRDEKIVIGDVMLVSLSFDHRLVDGHVGAAFAYEVIRYLQDPTLLLLETI